MARRRFMGFVQEDGKGRATWSAPEMTAEEKAETQRQHNVHGSSGNGGLYPTGNGTSTTPTDTGPTDTGPADTGLYVTGESQSIVDDVSNLGATTATGIDGEFDYGDNIVSTVSPGRDDTGDGDIYATMGGGGPIITPEIITPEVVVEETKVCWDGSVIPITDSCPPEPEPEGTDDGTTGNGTTGNGNGGFQGPIIPEYYKGPEFNIGDSVIRETPACAPGQYWNTGSGMCVDTPEVAAAKAAKAAEILQAEHEEWLDDEVRRGRFVPDAHPEFYDWSEVTTAGDLSLGMDSNADNSWWSQDPVYPQAGAAAAAGIASSDLGAPDWLNLSWEDSQSTGRTDILPFIASDIAQKVDNWPRTGNLFRSGQPVSKSVIMGADPVGAVRGWLDDLSGLYSGGMQSPVDPTSPITQIANLNQGAGGTGDTGDTGDSDTGNPWTFTPFTPAPTTRTGWRDRGGDDIFF
jgi:hypothetical protein